MLFNPTAESEFITDFERQISAFTSARAKVTLLTPYSSMPPQAQGKRLLAAAAGGEREQEGASGGEAGSGPGQERRLLQVPGGSPKVIVQYGLIFPGGATDSFMYQVMQR